MTVPKSKARPADSLTPIPLEITKGVRVDKRLSKTLSDKMKLNKDLAENIVAYTKENTEPLKQWQHGNAARFETLVMSVGTEITESKIKEKMTDEEYNAFVQKRDEKMTDYKEIFLMAKRYYTGKKAVRIIEGQPHKIRRVIEVTKGKKGKERVVSQSEHKVVFCKDGQHWDPVAKRCYVYAERRHSEEKGKNKKETK